MRKNLGIGGKRFRNNDSETYIMFLYHYERFSRGVERRVNLVYHLSGECHTHILFDFLAKLTLRWPRGGGGVDATPTGFSNFSQKWEEVVLQTKCLPVGSSFGHLPMKKFFKSDLPSWLQN